MKHSVPVVLVIIVLFLLAQFIGLFIVNSYYDPESTEATGVPTYEPLPAGVERPSGGPVLALVTIAVAVIIGTMILLLIIKFKKTKLWKGWYFVAVTLSLGFAWANFVEGAVNYLTVGLSLGVALSGLISAGILWVGAAVSASLKIFRPNFIIHNLTELFIYGGMAAIFVPVLNVFSAAILLLLLSAYDVFAVRGSKHMITLAKFQQSSKIFAGLSIPKSVGNIMKPIEGSKSDSGSKDTSGVAILGGGDIGFPLLFAGTVMVDQGFAQAFLVPVFAAIGLSALFALSKQGKFYPAMPFVSAGCFVGYGVALLITYLSNLASA